MVSSLGNVNTSIPRTLSPDAATLDAPPEPSSSAEQPHVRRVALVEGSTPQLSGETRSLLRSRLRAASLLLAIGFTLFVIRNLFVVDYSITREVVLLGMEACSAVVLGLFGLSLCRKCQSSNFALRTKEAVVFGMPAIYFLATQYFDAFHPRGVYVESPSTPWVALIFTYAMFIPNTWRRAAVVIVAMALAPVALYSAAYFSETSARVAMAGEHLTTLYLMMILSALGGVWGVYTIGRLREEAFEARQFGQYRLGRLIGSGGMGEVYLAEHQLLKRPCAIKVIRPSKAADPQALARFEREVRATARLTHWNTVEIFDYGRTEDGTFYYVMEYLPGLSLAELVARHGPLPPARAIHLLRQTCEALGEAHSEGLVHRDIKPGNIFAAQRGGVFDVAKLLDFGLAKKLAHGTGDPRLTQEGSITGSPLFMSPEQATGDTEPDARSDIYSLGAVAYYLLTGRPPFQSDQPMKVIIAHASEAVTPASVHRPELPGDLDDVVLRCLAKDPIDRYQNTAELGAALASCDTADEWTRDDAARWWASICPNRKLTGNLADIDIDNTACTLPQPAVASAAEVAAK